MEIEIEAFSVVFTFIVMSINKILETAGLYRRLSFPKYPYQTYCPQAGTFVLISVQACADSSSHYCAWSLEYPLHWGTIYICKHALTARLLVMREKRKSICGRGFFKAIMPKEEESKREL